MARHVPSQIAKQLQNVPAPWQAEAENENPELAKPQMYLCHMMDEELEALDNLQGGVSIDPETGVREYSAIAPLLDNPQIIELFMTVYSDLSDDGELTEPLQKAYEEAQRISLPYRETPAEKTKEIDKLEDLGEGGDTKFAFLPENLVRLLIALRGGEPSLNTKTGLMEFFSLGKVFKNVISAPFKAINKITGTKIGTEALRVAGTIGGAMLGGPLGAGIGNAAAHWVTGNSLGNSLMSGVKNFGLVGALHGIGGLMPGVATGAASMAGAAHPLASNAVGALTNYGQGYTGLMGGIGAATGAAGATGSAAGALMPAGATATQAAQQVAQPSLMDKFGNIVGSKGFQGLASLGTMGLAYLGEKHHHQQELERERRQHDYIAQLRKDRGFDEPFNPKKYRQVKNPNFNPTEEDMAMGRYSEPEYNLEEYAHGGNVGNASYREGNMIKGPGNGQQDKIKTHVPVNSEIIDATSVSMLGDGSSEAGAQILKRMEQQIKKNASPKQIHSLTQYFEHHKGQAPVYLSNDEYRIDPVSVSILGKGNPDKGSLEFRKMVKNLRKHKMSNGLELPPPARNPFEYMRG